MTLISKMQSIKIIYDQTNQTMSENLQNRKNFNDTTKTIDQLIIILKVIKNSEIKINILQSDNEKVKNKTSYVVRAV